MPTKLVIQGTVIFPHESQKLDRSFIYVEDINCRRIQSILFYLKHQFLVKRFIHEKRKICLLSFVLFSYVLSAPKSNTIEGRSSSPTKHRAYQFEYFQTDDGSEPWIRRFVRYTPLVT